MPVLGLKPTSSWSNRRILIFLLWMSCATGWQRYLEFHHWPLNESSAVVSIVPWSSSPSIRSLVSHLPYQKPLYLCIILSTKKLLLMLREPRLIFKHCQNIDRLKSQANLDLSLIRVPTKVDRIRLWNSKETENSSMRSQLRQKLRAGQAVLGQDDITTPSLTDQDIVMKLWTLQVLTLI